MDVLRSLGEQGGLELKYQKPPKPKQLSQQGQLPLMGRFALWLPGAANLQVWLHSWPSFSQGLWMGKEMEFPSNSLKASAKSFECT